MTYVSYDCILLYCSVEISEQNFPESIRINYAFQAIEIARRAVQPPLKPKPK